MNQLPKPARLFGAGELLQLFRDFQPHTKAELSEWTGLSRSTITQRLESLIQLGLIHPASSAASTGGRPSAQLELNPFHRLIAAVDFGATHVSVAICTLDVRILAASERELSITEGPEVALAVMAEEVRSLLHSIGHTAEDVGAVGIGLPGPVEYSTGKPAKPPIMPGWDAFDVPERVKRDFAHVAVLVDNDVNLMALGERHVAFPDVENMIFLKVATGIGSGIIAGGELQRGAQGTAGDIGHVRLTRGADIQCRCGYTGCLEAVASVPAVLGEINGGGSALTNVAGIIEAVDSGHVQAIQAVRQAGRDVGQVLTTCVSLINPSVIVIGGSLSRAGEHLLAGVREVVYSRSMPLASQQLTIEQSIVGREAGVIGAGVLGANYLLSADVIDELVTSAVRQAVA